MGVKPLLYRWNGETLVFASELMAVLASGLGEQTLSPTSLHTLLSFGAVAQPDTIVEDIRALPPGAISVLEGPSAPLPSNRSLTLSSPSSNSTYSDTVAAVDSAMTKAIAVQTADRKRATVFLSGGIDSALLAALMLKQGTPVEALTLSLQSFAPQLDESKMARRVASDLGIPHRCVSLTEADIRTNFDRFIQRIDQPTVDGFNVFLLSGGVPPAERVVFTGTGPDELLLGYSWMLEIARDLITVSTLSTKDLAEHWLQHCRFHGTQGILHPAIADQVSGAAALEEAIAEADPGPGLDIVSRLRHICLHRFTLDRLLRDADVCTMAFGLECRMPFLHPSLVSAITRVCPEHVRPAKNPHGRSYATSGLKRIVVDVARRYLPSYLFTTGGKWGFILPHAIWLQGPLQDQADAAFSDGALATTGVFDAEALRRRYHCFTETGQYANEMWLAFVLQAWLLAHDLRI
jgi:asparagine synthase (glutamine-hydrolysing)